MNYNKKSALWLLLLWMMSILLAFTLESCRTLRQNDIYADESNSISLDEHRRQSIDYTSIDSFLHRWAMTIDGFEADIRIPLTTAPVFGERSADTLPEDSIQNTQSLNTQPPCIDIHLRGESLKMDGEHRGRVEQFLKDSSDVNYKLTSQNHTTSKVKKKKTRLPAYLWWAAIPFVLFLIIYIVRRWQKKN